MQDEEEYPENFAAQTECFQAFYAISGFLCGHLVAAGIADQDDTVSRLEALATNAGAELAKITGQTAVPNQYLMTIANGVRTLGAPLSLVPKAE